ncbi:LysR family transcriptional regulator [Brucella intermedia]|uniref:LysR family transcriptional regulator n=1 Tax=Brucella intermedia TaxID=94625 RepID=UPI003208520C
MVDFRGLETLVWVASLGSFRKAAEKLSATQPAISHRITQLEDQVGAKLLVRDGRHAAPTAHGRIMLSYAEKMLALRAEMLSQIRDKSAVRGVVRLGAAESIVQTWLPDFIKKVSEVYPQLSIEIEVDISLNLQAMLLNQEIDIAFLQGAVSAPRACNRLLCEYPIGFIAKSDLKLPKTVTISDIASYPIITFSRKTQPYEVVKSLFNHSSFSRVKIHASASMATAIKMALDGMGVAVIPIDLVFNEISDGKLKVLECDASIPSLSFFASWLDAPENYEVALVGEIAFTVASQWQKSRMAESDFRTA